MHKKRIFEIIQIGQRDDIPSLLFDWYIVLSIILNISVIVLETFDELLPYYSLFHKIEVITIVSFTIELLLRLWTADYLYQKGSIKSAFNYLASFNGIVELISILAFYLPFLFPMGIVAFRVFRVVKILRLFQANGSSSFSAIVIVLNRKKNQLLSSLLMILMVMIMASLTIYGFEHEAQPDLFRNAFSGIWWSVSAILTVGYGDIYPITLLGKLAGIIITFSGVCLVAVPTGILSAGFTEYFNEQKQNTVCPHCGKKPDDVNGQK